MKLCPRELEGLYLHQAGALAQKRLARGTKLNYPEAVALISSQIQEFARDGDTVAELMDKGRQLLGRMQVISGVPEMIKEIQVEATFPDGTKLVSLKYPICCQHGNLKLALYGSFLPVPNLEIFEPKNVDLEALQLEIPPGCVYPSKAADIELNSGRDKIALEVVSQSDRAIQVGSHFNFLECNKRLVFDRALAYGKRLNIPAGNAIRFEPGESRTVTLVDISGNRVIHGGNSLSDGQVDIRKLPKIMDRVLLEGFGNKKQAKYIEPSSCFMSRFLYAKTYGPTLGDKVKLGDTCLVVEVEKDFTVYGDECKFGGGKVLRDGMGMCSRVTSDRAVDLILINCLIIDAVQGIVKADVGIKGTKIVGIGKAGNIDTMAGVHPDLIVGAGTDVIAADGMILTAGGIDTHVHFICPQQAQHAVCSGITTMIGGGTGMSTGTCCSTASPGYVHIRNMIRSTDVFPLNFGFTGKGNVSQAEGLAKNLVEQIAAGAIGLKIHEDWGASPAAIDCALRVADELDIQITIHTDTLNESGCCEDSIAAFKGRTIHTYHTEGAGGGHAPDIIAVCGIENVLPSSTTPTCPFTINTIDEHLDMLMTCHHLNKNLREDIAFAESRIRAETIAAEDVLHDMGGISMMASDSQAMGRIGEIITRTWQMADKMKNVRGRLPEEQGQNDNFRVKRYIAKYTINPAIAHGVSHVIGSVEVGKMADLVLWDPAFFGAKPNVVIKGGQIAWGIVGNPNASIPTPEPMTYRKMFGAYGKCTQTNSCIFVSQLSVDNSSVNGYGICKNIVPIRNVRNITKHSMVHNNFLPKIKVDPEGYKVYVEETAEGEKKWLHLTCPPSASLPLAQRYFLF